MVNVQNITIHACCPCMIAIKLFFIGTFSEFKEGTKIVHLVLSRAVCDGYLEVVKRVVDYLNSFSLEFEKYHAGFDKIFGLELSGLQHCQRFNLVTLYVYLN